MKENKINYKDTLNLPKTDFAMKANLPVREQEILKFWDRIDIYRCLTQDKDKKNSFILHDGPPYANGNIHIGHALNKILKDIIVKCKIMQGYFVPFIPGWDCHGLPVEHQLFKELKISKNNITQLEFRKKAYEFALKFVEVQKGQFKRLGIFGDWAHPYLTMSYGYEAAIVRAFAAIVDKGYIYKGLKPVNWCGGCETALAEAEVEYAPHVSPSIFVKFRLEDNQIFSKDTSLVIWTTTPWTLIANTAVAVHPEFLYAHIQTKQGELILADIRKPVLSQIGIDEFKVLGTFKGKDLEGLIYEHPFGLRRGKVVLADYVSGEEGTGLVHTAPGHGAEDYLTGLKYDLPVIMPVDRQGRFDSTAGDFQGQNVFQANKTIITKLNECRLLLKEETIAHSYPHCWRCKKPIIFRATEQWFMSIDRDNLRRKIEDVIRDKVKWLPASGRERILKMVENRPDWCLSRQRYWGVPIPVFYCQRCNQSLLDGKIILQIAELMEKHGADIWFSKKEEELLPGGTVCSKCQGASFRKETDILDVWFDSGISHQAVLKKNKDLRFPADLYLEGSDQHRGWFQSALITSQIIEGTAPYHSVLTHGFIVDGEGHKMSKSLGNVISPHDVTGKLGADILRLWVASCNYNDDVRISDEILTRSTDAYRKIRNTFRFILGNLYDFDPGRDEVDIKQMFEVDRWIISYTQQLLLQINKNYENFIFHNIVKIIYNFCIVQLSSFYLDILKDRLYTTHAKSIERRSAQTALNEVLNVLVKIISPILPFTAEEIWQHQTRLHQNTESIYQSTWPAENNALIDENLNQRWEIILEVRNAVLKELENARTMKLIGSSQEAEVCLAFPESNPLYLLLEEYTGQLAGVFVVSAASLEINDKPDTDTLYNIKISEKECYAVRIRVTRAAGGKCQRCWNYHKDIGKNTTEPKLCSRCASVLTRIFDEKGSD
ncbi:MAG: isoleucine--tRNA ligase [Candidatus Omnitrophota bacterium]